MIRAHLKGRIKTIVDSVYEVEVKSDGSKVNEWVAIDTEKYDELGNDISHISYSLSGKLIWRDIFKHDTRGNQVEENLYKNNGRLEQKTILFYNSGDSVIKTFQFDSTNKLGGTSDFKYDKRSHSTEDNEYELDGHLSARHVYFNDINGNTIKVVHGIDSIIGIDTYKYDDFGNKIQWCLKMPGTKRRFVNNYKYKDFDKTGNWLNKIESYDDEPKWMIKRIIEYYP